MVLGKISLKYMPDMGETLVLFSHMTELAFGANIYHFFLPVVFLRRLCLLPSRWSGGKHGLLNSHLRSPLNSIQWCIYIQGKWIFASWKT